VSLPDADALLDAAFAAPAGVALVALDLPGDMAGIEAAKFLVFSSIGRVRTAVYGLAAGSLNESLQVCLGAGLAGCLAKPLRTGAIEAAAQSATARPFDSRSLPPGVRAIAEHPRIRPADPALDLALLRELEALGGPRFLAELIDEFLRDAQAIRHDLGDIVERGDAAGFRARVQAMRSAAANIGAQAVFTLCLSWRQTGRRQLSALGRERLRHLDIELGRASRAFAALRLSPDGRTGAGL
jgi:two-component system sensor histidine kinase RpfC